MTDQHVPSPDNASDDVVAPDGDPTAAGLVRHEERLLVTTERFATERVRLEKFIVTEERTITVTVRHEEIRMTREPLDADTLIPGPVSTDEESPRVIILHEERPVVTMQVVPLERVWLEKNTVTEQVSVADRVGHEEIELLTAEHTD